MFSSLGFVGAVLISFFDMILISFLFRAALYPLESLRVRVFLSSFIRVPFRVFPLYLSSI